MVVVVVVVVVVVLNAMLQCCQTMVTMVTMVLPNDGDDGDDGKHHRLATMLSFYPGPDVLALFTTELQLFQCLDGTPLSCVMNQPPSPSS